MFKSNFTTERFHVDFGPDSLFQRIEFKMKDQKQLLLDGTHYNQRVSERDIPGPILNALCDFDIHDWKVVTAEVRVDKGKFVNSTWEKIIDGKQYWVTIGFRSFVETIIYKNTSGTSKCIRNGILYDYVKEVNEELMQQEQ